MTMTDTLKVAEQMVADLVNSANRRQSETRWRYELTSDIDNIGVMPDPGGAAHVLLIHPCWLRYVIAQGEFESCVADEIEAWHLLARWTGGATTTTA